MRIACIHCAKEFRIAAEQLGGAGVCPHCGGTVQLPAAAAAGADAADERSGRGHWLHNSLSGLISISVHMLLALLLALVSYDSYRGAGLGEDVLIGTLPSEVLGPTQQDVLQAESVSAPDTSNEQLEIEPPIASSDPLLVADTALAPSPSGGAAQSFDLGAVSIGGGAMSGGSWDGMLQNLRRNGLDIVITFDSTGSMSGEINQVKSQIARIGETLLKLVPKARIGICTYRDRGDQFLVRGTPLSSDLQELQYFLGAVSAEGGGDHPEAVHEGLRWAIENNDFRSRARKVILLFGDAPPHAQQQRTCLELASDFHSQHDGVVSTVTCRANRRMPQFVEIAEVGGGEAFLTQDERQIVTQLMVLVFGSRHRDKVLEAFKILER